MAWLLGQEEGLTERAGRGEICLGTIDSWLIWQLTQEHAFKTDYSNASRTQLMNLKTLAWDEELAGISGSPWSAWRRSAIRMRFMAIPP